MRHWRLQFGFARVNKLLLSPDSRWCRRGLLIIGQSTQSGLSAFCAERGIVGNGGDREQIKFLLGHSSILPTRRRAQSLSFTQPDGEVNLLWKKSVASSRCLQMVTPIDGLVTPS